jgi:pimeloyl-ACP methyl ester carboxylesterase
LSRCILCALAIAFAPMVASAQSSGRAALTSCMLPEVHRAARCGSIDVAENPAQPRGRRLQIAVAVIPATKQPALEDPLVVLMGGPGEAAIVEAAYYAKRFEALLEERDLLLVDQRGTGRSNGLQCELYSPDAPATSLRDIFPVDAAQRCAQRSQQRADLTQYTFAHFARDLEHVRKTLGYGPLNLSAGSYGTRAAQVYMRMYPRSVRTAYLGSVAPIDVATPLTFAKTAQAALESTFAACAVDAACKNAFPSVQAEFTEVLSRLRAGEVRVRAPGVDEPVQLHAGRVVEWLRSRMYRPSTAAELPWLIHRAYTGDWSPIVTGVLENARGADEALSFGLFFSITCSEDVAFIRETEVEPATQGSFAGDFRVRQQQAACERWPKAALPPDYREPVRSSTPTMFVSGDVDAASPLWFTERVARGFSNRVEIVLRGRGHTESNACVERLYERFVREGSVQGLVGSSCAPEARPPFETGN